MDFSNIPQALCVDCAIPARHTWTEAMTENGKRFARQHFECRSCARLQYRDVADR